LTGIFLVLFIINSAVFMRSEVEVPWRRVLLVVYGMVMLVCGLSAGIVGFIAVIRRCERSWIVWLAMLPGMLVLGLIIGELLMPH
jgi:hypothetical protein